MMVVKIGGGPGIRHDAVFKDVKAVLDRGEKVVVVHGANHEMAVMSQRLGHRPRMLTSVSGYESRYTDASTMDIFKMVYCGKVNTTLVEACHRVGIRAVGLSGVDGALLTGPRKDAIRIIEDGRKRIVRDDLSGKVEHVNVGLLMLLMNNGFLPLICPPALSHEHQAINVDGDRAAAMIAGALAARVLIILSDVPGLLRDRDDERSLIGQIDARRIGEYQEFAQGRMKKKVMAAIEAIELGVGEVIFADGRVDEPIARALRHEGTRIYRHAT